MSEGIVRKATLDDVEGIYDVCCAVELGASKNKKGFLLTQYSAHPEMKEGFQRNIVEGDVFVYDEGGVRGFLVGYPLSYWKWERGDSLLSDTRYSWDDDALRSLGVESVSGLESLVVRDKAAVHPDSSGKGVGPRMLAHYAQLLADRGVDYQLSAVVEKVWSPDHSLGFINEASASYQRKIGASRVGETAGSYARDDTFLGPGARFKDGIYLVRTSDVLNAVGVKDNEMSYHKP